jgi:hypothetical protein
VCYESWCLWHWLRGSPFVAALPGSTEYCLPSEPELLRARLTLLVLRPLPSALLVLGIRMSLLQPKETLSMIILPLPIQILGFSWRVLRLWSLLCRRLLVE